MNNFTVRTISGAVFAAIVIGLTIFSSDSLFALLILISCIGIYEFLKLQKSNDPIKLVFAVLVNLLILLTAYKNGEHRAWAIAGTGSLCLLFLVIGLRQYGTKILENIVPAFFSFIYISIPLFLFYMYAQSDGDYDFRRPLMVFLLVWSSDTFAYISGRSFGKHALSTELSPKKTWEGFVGGTILTGVLGGVLSYYWHFFDIPSGIILGVLVSIFGTAGDLFESALKRSSGVKDSGNIIPGHGGILDRFDAFLFVCVLVYLFHHIVTLI